MPVAGSMMVSACVLAPAEIDRQAAPRRDPPVVRLAHRPEPRSAGARSSHIAKKGKTPVHRYQPFAISYANS
jgi:hypothetical protein